MKLTYANCQRAILEALMAKGHTPDEAMAIWNATKLNRFENDEFSSSGQATVSEEKSDGCSMQAAESGSSPSVLLARSKRRCDELEKELADSRIELRHCKEGTEGVLHFERNQFAEFRSQMEQRDKHNSKVISNLRAGLEIIAHLEPNYHVGKVVEMALNSKCSD